MSKHIRKLFNEEEVIEILNRYLQGEIAVEQAQALLKIKRRRFFDILKFYRTDPDQFSLAYKRKKPTRQLPIKIESKIEEALKKEKLLIEDKHTPIRRYNYSYIKNKLEKENVQVSLSSIIRRAKKKGFINSRNRKRILIKKS
jgi:hypothetical protein